MKTDVYPGNRVGDADAEAAQQAAEQRGRHPKQAKPAPVPGLAERVKELLGMLWPPHAELRQGCTPPPQRVCAETIYRACV